MVHASRRAVSICTLLALCLVVALPCRSAPPWLHDAVIYEVYPRDFSASGDFNGVTAQFGRLKQLGVDVVWLMPIHPIGTLKRKGTLGSPYSIRDYYGINPDYGTAADLRRLVDEAHRQGLRIVMDIVANHTSWDSVLMKHSDYYTHDGSGHIVPPNPDWVDVADLDYSNVRLQRYMLDMLKYWVREFDVDGFRCDYAVGVPTAFWEQAREELRAVKPDILWLAEAEEPALLAKAFDIDYSWAFYHVLTDVIQGRKPATALQDVWRQSEAKYPRGTPHMRFIDNHDENRAIARFGEAAALAAAALIFTLDGVPMIYNGMEVGDTTESGAPALFEKIPVYWLAAQRRPQFPPFYENIIALRKAHPALTLGDVSWLHNSDESRVLTFTRQGGDSGVMVAINLSSQPFAGSVHIDQADFVEITPHGPGAQRELPNPLPQLSLAAWEFRVFRRLP